MTTSDTNAGLDPCPTSEDLAAFLDRAAGEKQTRLVSHLTDCETCYELFAGAAHLLRELTEPPASCRPPS